MTNPLTQLSLNLLIDGEASIEGLRRAQLLSDVVVIPGTDFRQLDKEFETEISHMSKRTRIEFMRKADMDYIRDKSEDDEQYIEKLLHFLSEAMLRAFKSGKVTTELHEFGHRIRWAYDDGSEEFPATPLSESFGLIENRIPSDPFDENVEDFIARHDGFGASRIQQEYVASAVFGKASQWLLLRRVMDRFSQQYSAWPRLGLFGEYSGTVKWTQKIFDDNVHLDARNAEDVGKLLRVALPRPRRDVKLRDIEAAAFYELCDGMKDARDRFTRKMVEWCDVLSASDPEARTVSIKAIRKDEVIPAIEEFNDSTRSLWCTVKAIGGGDIATISVGALTAAAFWATGYGPVISGISALPTTVKVVGDVIKKTHEAREVHRRQWVAFATKLDAALPGSP